MEVINTFSYFLLIVLGINVEYFLVFSIASLFPLLKYKHEFNRYNRFAVLIPAYKGDDVIIATMHQSFIQDYPRDKYDIVIIADSLKSYAVGELKLHPVIVLEVEFENSTKAKSLNFALSKINQNEYDYIVVLDIDNEMEETYLTKVNERLQNNEEVLQTHRVAKNLDTSFSVLDAMSEEINNSIFRKGHAVMGMSSALIGSGMIIRTDVFTFVMNQIHAIGGFDKELELRLLEKGYKIEYAHDILVYDEKVSHSEVFTNQRKRWMAAQVNYVRKYFLKAFIVSLTKLQFDYFDKVMQLVVLPRVITLGSLFLLGSLYFVGLEFHIYFILFFFINVISMFVALPNKFYNAKSLSAIFYIPKGFVLMFLTMFKLKGANKKFIHTPHSVKDK